VLDNKVYKHTLRIFNNYCLSTATTVSLTHLNVKIYAHWDSFPVAFIET